MNPPILSIKLLPPVAFPPMPPLPGAGLGDPDAALPPEAKAETFAALEILICPPLRASTLAVPPVALPPSPPFPDPKDEGVALLPPVASDEIVRLAMVRFPKLTKFPALSSVPVLVTVENPPLALPPVPELADWPNPPVFPKALEVISAFVIEVLPF
jgi:hypothetical protein